MSRFRPADSLAPPKTISLFLPSLVIVTTVLAVSSFAQGALAGDQDCRAIESIGGRLACYDTAFPPIVKRPKTVDSGEPRAPYIDPFVAADARTAAKLKSICRGC